MIFNMIYGGGVSGAVLNVLRVPSLPETVVNGQVVVISDIPALRIDFGYSLPPSPAAGDIWMHVVDNGAYPTELDDGLSHVTITLGAALQYISGAWAYREAYVGVAGAWKMCSTLSPLSTLSWSAIGALAKSGEDLSQFFDVGAQKQVVLNATTLGSASFYAEIIGFAHDDLVAGGKAGITFGMVDCFNTIQRMAANISNSGGWVGCELRATLRDAVYNALPDELRTNIREVNKATSAGGQSNVINVAADTLFLFSEIEITGSASYSFPGEGTIYSRFSVAANRIKKVGASSEAWWSRSPYKSNTENYCVITNSGASSSYGATNQLGVACGFCM